MENNTTLRFAGDVLLRNVEVRSLNGQIANITNQVESIEVYEDLFSSFISASIVLRESVDYLNLFPFIGEEFVNLDIVTPSLEIPIKGRFYVYKITDRMYTREREVVYTIKCISEEFLTDSNTRISKAYDGKLGLIAAYILEKDGFNTQKRVNIEDSANTTKFTANYWSPTRCLNYAAAAAFNKAENPSFLFYENRDGFNFRSIDELLKFDTYHKFTKDNYTRELQSEESTKSKQDPTEDYKRILEFNVPVLTDYMKEVQSGHMKSRVISHDLVTKRYSVKNYSIKEDPKANTLLNPTPGYSKYAISNFASTQIVVPKHFQNFNNYGDVTNYKIAQKRLAFFSQLEKYKITIQVNGRTDYTVGQIMDLNIPKATQITKEDTETRDLILSGRYLVSAVNHTITREKHTCNMELIKNSILTDLTKY
jgi:hypothetical protein